MAHEIREQYGEGLSREEYIRVARAFGSAVVPKRKPGRPRKAQVTAALADWKAAGMTRLGCHKETVPGEIHDHPNTGLRLTRKLCLVSYWSSSAQIKDQAKSREPRLNSILLRGGS